MQVHTPQVLPRPARRSAVGVQTREATVLVQRAVYQPSRVEALKIRLCRPEFRGRTIPPRVSSPPLQDPGSPGPAPEALWPASSLLGFTIWCSLAHWQSGRGQAAGSSGCCLGELCCTFYPGSWEGPRIESLRRTFADRCPMFLHSTRLLLCLSSTQI